MSARFATVSAGTEPLYGVITDAGFTVLAPLFPQWGTLRDVIAAHGLFDLATAAESLAPTHLPGSFTYAIPVPDPEKIICVGVNFPDATPNTRTGPRHRRTRRCSSAFRAASPAMTAR